jgi:hypothetical protein
MVIIFLAIMTLGLQSSIVSACTGFTASNENTVLVGNNEDLSLLAEPQLRIYPPSGNSYGAVVFYCKWPFPFDTGTYSAFGGMNDQGLFFDIYSTPYLAPTNPLNKPTYNNDIFAYCIRACATVDEVVDTFTSYYIPYMDEIQGFFVDKTGQAAILEGDDVIYKSENYQVVTNFLQTHPELGGYPCWRYDTAVEMLEEMTNLSVDYFRDICEAVHVENIQLPGFMLDTIYSYICDLNQGIMYVYFFHEYGHFMEIRLPDIFEQGYQTYDVAALFANSSMHKPNKPEKVTGSVSGRIHNEYTYTTSGTDDDGDLLFYWFDWGDGSDSGWIGYYPSGEECSVSHVWTEEGNFEIKVKTKDIFGYESEWSDPLSVTMPRNKGLQTFSVMPLFLEKYPRVYAILRQILWYA